MQVVRAADVEWENFAEQRVGEIKQKRLIVGDKDRSDNFEFSIVWVPEAYSTPRHRHIFDQIRFVRRGEFGYSAGKAQKAGEISYFSEGTYYTQKAEGESETLLLQFGSASGTGFVKREEVMEAMAEMAKKGEFHDGIYTRYEGDRKINQDATEAIYQYYYKQPIKYPAPRYDEPIIIHPDTFRYRSLPGVKGVAYRNLGVFTEAEITIGFVRVGKGARYEAAGEGAPVLLYALSGAGTVDGTGWAAETAFYVEIGEAVTFEAQEEAELFLIRLPRFDNLPG